MNQTRMYEWTQQMREAIHRQPNSVFQVLQRIVAEADSEECYLESYAFRLILGIMLLKNGELSEAKQLASEMQEIEKKVALDEEFRASAIHFYKEVKAHSTGELMTKDGIRQILSRQSHDLGEICSLLLKLAKMYAAESQLDSALQVWQKHIDALMVLAFVQRQCYDLSSFPMVTFEAPAWLVPIFQQSDDKKKWIIADRLLDICEMVDTDQEMFALTLQSVPLLEEVRQWLQQNRRMKKHKQIHGLIEIIFERKVYWESRLNQHGEEMGRDGTE